MTKRLKKYYDIEERMGIEYNTANYNNIVITYDNFANRLLIYINNISLFLCYDSIHSVTYNI